VSTLKVDTINTSDGTGNITVSRPLSGSGASLTSLPAANLTGTLPAISGASLTNLPAHTGNVAFPATQVASADANTLDDYEEGTWTPLIIGSSGTSGQTYSVQSGFYVKIGRTVIAYAKAVASTIGTISGSARMSGLPFTVANVSAVGSAGMVPDWFGWNNTRVFVGCAPLQNTTQITLRHATAAATSSAAVPVADIVNDSEVKCCVIYHI